MAVRRGKGTKIRWAVLGAGVTARPATATLRTITGLQSADWNGNQELEDAPNGDFESVDEGRWRDGDEIAQLGWTMDLSGHLTDLAAQKVELDAIYAAWKAGSKVWLERLRPGDTHWKGGRGLLQDPTEPAAYDAELTWSASLLGQGEPVETADVA